MRRQQPEKREQAAGVRLLRVVCDRHRDPGEPSAVYVLGHARRRGDYQGTMQSPGLPDVIAILPQGHGVLIWEVKAPHGRPSVEQRAFADRITQLERAGVGVRYCLGTYDVLIGRLVGMGLLLADQVPHYRRPADPVVDMGVAR